MGYGRADVPLRKADPRRLGSARFGQLAHAVKQIQLFSNFGSDTVRGHVGGKLVVVRLAHQIGHFENIRTWAACLRLDHSPPAQRGVDLAIAAHRN